jgi:hypothetical protein
MASSGEREDVLVSEIPDPTNILLARLDNWIHVVQLLQDYVESQLNIQKAATSGLEKAKKAVSDAPKFDFAPAAPAGAGVPDTAAATPAAAEGEIAPKTGIAEAFEAIRGNTEFLLNRSSEVEQQIKTAIIPQLETLKGDIEKHYKGFKGPGLKGQKDVEKAKQTTQKNIENLGHHVSSFGATSGGKGDYKNDPYVVHRQCLGSVNDLLVKENAQIEAIISVQNNFKTLEAHIVQVLQQAVSVLEQVIRGYASDRVESYETITGKFNNIQAEHEWTQFSQGRAGEVLIPDNAPRRQLNGVSFHNQDHKSTQPAMQGILQRKGKLMKSYTSSFYVLTQARYLHQFKSQDFLQDPTPEMSLYLPECTIGHPSPRDSPKFKFIISGKDASKTISPKLSYTFKTNTYDEMMSWHEALAIASGRAVVSPVTSGGPSEPTSPVSPVAATAGATMVGAGAAGAGAAGAGTAAASNAGGTGIGAAATSPVTPVAAAAALPTATTGGETSLPTYSVAEGVEKVHIG